MKKSKLRYVQKKLPKLNLINETSYVSLTDLDSLYSSKVHLLKNQEFSFLIHKTLRDFNFLLYLKEDDFFEELQQSASLRLSLQSCLTIFPRQKYNKYDSSEKLSLFLIQKNEAFADKAFVQYEQLMKAVLTIYLRISQAKKPKHLDIIYNEWILDIAKMLDLCSIYGDSNLKIVKEIISNIYKSIPNYDDDTLTFFNVIEEHHIEVISLQLIEGFDFSNMKNASNFFNYESHLIKSFMKFIFGLKDLLLNCQLFIRCFPEKYGEEFVFDYKLQESLTNMLIRCYHCLKNCVLAKYQLQFRPYVTDLKQSIISYFISQFNRLKVLSKSSNMNQNALITYEMYSLMLTDKYKSKESQHLAQSYKQIINYMIEGSPFVFFISPKQIPNIKQRGALSIQSCIKYQSDYRKSLDSFDTQLPASIEKLFRQMFGQLKRKPAANIQLSSDILKQQKQKEIKLEEQREGQPKQEQEQDKQAKKQQDPQWLLKYKYYSQYDDEPEMPEFNRVELLNDYQILQKQPVRRNLKKPIYVQKSSVASQNTSIYQGRPSYLDQSQNMSLQLNKNSFSISFISSIGNESIFNDSLLNASNEGDNITQFLNYSMRKSNRVQTNSVSNSKNVPSSQNVSNKNVSNKNVLDQSNEFEQNQTIEQIQDQNLSFEYADDVGQESNCSF